MKINRNIATGIVVVVILGLIALAAVNAPALWEMALRMHGMR